MKTHNNEFPIGKVLHKNCLDYMSTLPDEKLDLIICDGPYGLNKDEWDIVSSIQEYNLILIKEFSRLLKNGGAVYLFGKADCIDFIDYNKYLNLKSKIVWYCPAGLAQGRITYTNNYDIIAYFIKGNRSKTFNLDAIRVPQLTELTQRTRCENVPSVKDGTYGKTKFNDRGKNPGDVWGDIKQLTYRSKELIDKNDLGVMQKPEKLIERLVFASSNQGELVFDPFIGTGTTMVVCKKLDRKAFGCEKDKKRVKIALTRLKKSYNQIDIVGYK